MVDPARTSDPTGIVGIEGNLQTGKVYVKSIQFMVFQ